MPDISTLIPDIQKLITRKDGWFSDEIATEFGKEVALRLKEQLGAAARTPTLRLSQMGPRCPKALWHSIHTPNEAEPLPPWAEIKFAYGHIIEALAIALAKAAGHLVTGEQDAVHVDGVTGHRDCVIDGCVVDVKSTSSIGFKKFKDGSMAQSDTFGYLEQLDGYLVGSLDDDLVSRKDRGYLLAIDKQLGHMCLYEHAIREQHIRERISECKRIVDLPAPPACGCGVQAEGKSGNIRLDTRASYSPFKHCCFPGLRTFLYASGPVFLSVVKKVPDVPEVDRHGTIVYN